MCELGLTVTTPSLTDLRFLMIMPTTFFDTLLGILAQANGEKTCCGYIILADSNHSQSIQLLLRRHVRSWSPSRLLIGRRARPTSELPAAQKRAKHTPILFQK